MISSLMAGGKDGKSGKGFIVNHEKDTIRGFIELLNTGAGSEKQLMNFYHEQEGRSTFSIGDIQAFQVNGEYYTLVKYHGIYPDYEQKGLCYMKMLEQGPIDLLEFSYTRTSEEPGPMVGKETTDRVERTDYYLRIEQDDPEDKFVRVKRDGFKDQMFDLVSDNVSLGKKIMEGDLTYHDTEFIITRYNMTQE